MKEKVKGFLGRKSTRIIFGALAGVLIAFVVFSNSPMTEHVKDEFLKPYSNLFNSLADSSLSDSFHFGGLTGKIGQDASRGIVSAADHEAPEGAPGRVEKGTIELVISIFVERAPSSLETESEDKSVLVKLISTNWSIQKRVADNSKVVFHQVPVGRCRLEVTRSGYNQYQKILRLSADPSQHQVRERITLTPKIKLAAIKGRVGLQNKVYGQKIQAGEVKIGIFNHKNQLIAFKKTDSNGYFFFHRLDPKESQKILFKRTGYWNRTVSLNLRNGQIEIIKLVLKRKVRVYLKVRNRYDGQAISDAEVYLNSHLELTNSLGIVKFITTYGQYNLIVKKTGFQTEKRTITVKEDPTKINLLINPLSRVGVKVRDSSTGQLLVGAKVALNGQIKETNDSGIARFVVVYGQYRLRAVKAGYNLEEKFVTINGDPYLVNILLTPK